MGQFAGDPRAAVSLSGGLECPFHLGGQIRMTRGPDAGNALQPVVKTRRRDFQNFTHESHGILLSVRLNKRIPQGCSLAKKAVAFFKISFSISRRRTLA